jgi:hypothetical protein
METGGSYSLLVNQRLLNGTTDELLNQIRLDANDILSTINTILDEETHDPYYDHNNSLLGKLKICRDTLEKIHYMKIWLLEGEALLLRIVSS